MDFRELMNTTEYDFLRTNERLGNRIMLLGLGGSYAYGTNNEGSDDLVMTTGCLIKSFITKGAYTIG